MRRDRDFASDRTEGAYPYPAIIGKWGRKGKKGGNEIPQ